MTIARDLGEFLRSRRARLTPEEAGFASGSSRRRVPGLRREEAALLAGISVDYYVQIERGDVRGVSEDVLGAIARALHLDDIELAHLITLSRAVRQTPRRPTLSPSQISPTLQRVLDTITDAAAFVHNGRADFLGGNRLAYALYADTGAAPGRPVNLPRFVFLDPKARSFYRRWDDIALATVGSLRAEAARDPYDGDLTELVDQLSARSDDFLRMWSTHDLTQYWGGTQYFHHPLVGDLDLDFVNFTVTGDTRQRLIVYTAPAASPSQAALAQLAASPP